MPGDRPNPFWRFNVIDLESKADEAIQRGDTVALHSILEVIASRPTKKRNEQLRTKIEGLLDGSPPAPSAPRAPEFDFAEGTGETSPSKAKPPQPPRQPQSETEQPIVSRSVPILAAKRHWGKAEKIPFPAISNRPEAILEAWSSIEVLSPPAFDRPQSLAGGDLSRVAKLELTLPWERGERSRPNYKMYYQIVLGSVEIEPAIEALVERFGDSRAERPPTRGNAVLAAIVVDKSGKLVEESAVGVSSFGWGLMTALRGDLADLARWADVEKQLNSLVEKALAPPGTGDEETDWRSEPLTQEVIDRAYRALITSLSIPSEWIHPPAFAIRSYVYFKDPNPPEPLLLNSFFINDLATAKGLFSTGEATHNLKAYLGAWVPANRKNLLEDRSALEDSVKPHSTPLARWPSNDRHSLALLQQAAVNLAFSATDPEGILGINGPPGTGKTTLLRDVVANVVAERAFALTAFTDPEAAFEHSGEKLMVGGSWLHLYKLNPNLRGFEMVVASSNNKAVENVSAELPGLTAIAKDAPHLRYFKTLSDAIHDGDTWGAIAAVLGNAQNRAKFKQTFWWDEDRGFNNYLRAAAGTRQEVQIENPDSGEMELRMPAIVQAENPSDSKEDALRRWKLACDRFKDVREKCLAWIAWLESLRTDLEKHSILEKQKQSTQNAEVRASARESATRRLLEQSQTQLRAIEHELTALEAKDAELATIRSEAKDARTQLAEAEASLKLHETAKPGAIRQLFNRKCLPEWHYRLQKLKSAVDSAAQLHGLTANRLKQGETACGSELVRLPDLRSNYRRALVSFQDAEKQWQNEAAAHQNARFQAEEASTALTRLLERLAEARSKHGVTFLDSAFWDSGHSTCQVSTAWFPKQAQLARDELFIAAIQLHKAFIDAAAKPIRNNLGALMNVFSSQSLPTAAKQALLADLWATLFLVIPLVSTTFASVQRMLGRLPLSGLGWLLIDEAGQAVPQAAVGAIMRARRIVVLGDPIQIEPVVTLPDVLTQSVLRRFGVDPDRFGAPVGSVQTLADAASPVMAEYSTKHGSRYVGVPLLVHRRCSSPMFETANNIAYAGLMVSAKRAEPSPILECLGQSRWIHVSGSGEDKWNDAEGAEVLKMLQKLRADRVHPDLYIVSPFVIVAERLRQLILKSNVLQDWIDEDDRSWVHARVGTVHTAQGREAEAVIFVLGAPNPAQTGARRWAGGRPNLLNVAVTRAKEALYVIGNRQLWREAGVFSELDMRLR